MVNMTTTRLKSEVDFDRDGKQNGFLRLPHSVHRSAYGYIPIPIIVVRNGDGPTALVIAGVHGDEYEGQVAASNLAKWLDPERIRGRVIILPVANFPAAMEGTRVSPIDAGNLNRLYPGDPDGTVTAQIAHYIEHVLLPKADVVFDLHSGGSSLMYLPSISFRRSQRPDLIERGIPAVKAMAAPIVYFSQEAQGGDRAIIGAAKRQGVLSISSELGGGGFLSPEGLRVTERAIRNLLVHMTILAPTDKIEPDGPSRFVEIGGLEYFVYAPEEGVFEPLVELGDMVSAGQPAARLHLPDTPWLEPEEVRFSRDGLVLCKRTIGRTKRGDCLLHLASDVAS